MLNVVETAHNALVTALNASAASVFDGLTATRDEPLPGEEVALYLNVVKPQKEAVLLAEQLGLGEDDVLLEFVQTFDVEFIVREDDETDRLQAHADGLIAIQTALYADRALGGAAAGLNLGFPVYDDARFPGAVSALACVIPVRVSLRGLSALS